jgi:hypothetical protein
MAFLLADLSVPVYTLLLEITELFLNLGAARQSVHFPPAGRR